MYSKRISNALFVGTGGGNDVFSTTLAMAALWRLGWRWDSCSIAGVLSPFHDHSVEYTAVPGMLLTTPFSGRKLPRYDSPLKIPFIDSKVSEMVRDVKPFGAERVYGLSLLEGSRGLTRTFIQARKRFDFVVLVDLGGDIFYGGARDPHVLSPMFDAAVLRAFVDSKVPGLLFEAGPGTDGELEPEALRESLAAAGAQAFPLDREPVEWWLDLFHRRIEPWRPGRTVPITAEAHASADAELRLKYRARAHLGVMRRYAWFEQRISTELCRQFFLVEPSRIANPFAVECGDPLDWFLKTQLAQRHTNNEANLEYLKRYDGLWQFLTPSPLFPAAERRELIAYALREQALRTVCDGHWLLPADLGLLEPGWERTFEMRQSELIELRRK